jgi:hypothetical protein
VGFHTVRRTAFDFFYKLSSTSNHIRRESSACGAFSEKRVTLFARQRKCPPIWQNREQFTAF